MTIKIKIMKKKGTMEFSLENATLGFANALRRIMISEVPTIAIEWTDFHDNSSAMFDEEIAYRLGLIPLKFDPKKFIFKDECKCSGKGCTLCQAVFALEKTGPCTVYSGDLKPVNKAVHPTNPKFPIVQLLKGQHISLEAVANMGTGSDHAKFQAANVTFKHNPETIQKGSKEEINKDPKKLIFRVESISGLEPQDIVNKAVEILENKANEFIKQVGKL
jgi:DNA-directed RNA polymerase alpha subunit